VILVLESFSYEYMGLENNKSSYTPFLNSLAAKSYFFKNAMADGRRSIEGIAALLSGIPAWMEEPFISSEFSSNQFLGLGSFLKAYDYTTSFFHGGKNGTMYFDSFSRAAGFDNYFGLNEYPEKEKHFDGTWGIYDHLYFKDVIAKTNSLKKPFLNVIFTLSSHHPYKIPDEYQDKFLDQDLPILKSVMYADESLKEFFDEAKKQPWFDNTIFILLADHTGKPNSEEFNHVIGSFRIPILLYSTKFNKDEIFESDKIIAQKDILNFIAEIVSIESRTNKVSFESATSDQIQKQFVFSKSIFDSSRRPHIVFDGFKYLVYDQFCLYEWSIEESQKYTLDSFFRKSLWTVEKNNRCSDEKFKSLEKYLKIHLQLFSEQLFDNRLYAPTR
jgi:phosphoglycerol transferase MdoB-like AlkP superfamily enzyme